MSLDADLKIPTRVKTTQPAKYPKSFHGRCQVCTSPRRAEVEAFMARGGSRRDAGKRFSLPPDAVWRHMHRHVPEQVKVARTLEHLAPNVTESQLNELIHEEGASLLETLRLMRAGLLRQFDAALMADDRPGVGTISRELHRNLEILGKASGELSSHKKTTVTHLVLSPDFLDFRAKLLAVLRQFPEAARAVSEVFRQVEERATEEMTAPKIIDAEVAPSFPDLRREGKSPLRGEFIDGT